MSTGPEVPHGALNPAERDALQDLVNAVLAIRRRQAVVDAARVELPELMAARDDAEARCRTLGLIAGRRRPPRAAAPARPRRTAPATTRPRTDPEAGQTVRDRVVAAVAGGASTAREVIGQVGAAPTVIYPTLTQLASTGALARVKVPGTGWVYSIPAEGAPDA